MAGGTTYREPMEGHATDGGTLPDAHAIASALAFARRGPEDIGPDVAYCLVLQSDAYRAKVTRLLAEALGKHMDGRELRHARPYVMPAVMSAWDAVIHLRGSHAKPPRCPSLAWDRMLLTAIATMHDKAWDALSEAERRYAA